MPPVQVAVGGGSMHGKSCVHNLCVCLQEDSHNSKYQYHCPIKAKVSITIVPNHTARSRYSSMAWIQQYGTQSGLCLDFNQNLS